MIELLLRQLPATCSPAAAAANAAVSAAAEKGVTQDCSPYEALSY